MQAVAAPTLYILSKENVVKPGEKELTLKGVCCKVKVPVRCVVV